MAPRAPAPADELPRDGVARTGAKRRAYRADRRRRKAFINAQLAGPQTIDDDDPRWDDLWTQSEDTSSDDDEA
jgi:hypothetical protein